MKKSFQRVIWLCAAPALWSCVLSAQQGTIAPSVPIYGDQDFVKEIFQTRNSQMQLGPLVAQKSQSSDVKDLGQRLVQDHIQLGEDVKASASKLGVDAPDQMSKEDQEQISKLEPLSGAAFDREYLQTMMKDQKQDLKNFKKEEEWTQDPDLKKAAQTAERVVSNHLQMIQQVARAHSIDTEADAEK